MTDSVQIWKPGFRILDDSGDPVAGGKIKFFAAGTATPRTVYTDKGLSANGSTVITADSSGVPQISSVDVVAYTNTSDYKVVITDASDNVLITVDNLAGALDTSNYLTTASATNFPVQSKTSTYPIAAADLGQVINCDVSGGEFTVTLLAAATAGDGASITIKKTDTSVNAVLIDGDGDNIDGNATFKLTREDNSVLLVCDGDNWHIQSSHNFGTYVTGTLATHQVLSTATEYNATTPQNNEGDEILTVAHTATSTGANVRITFSAHMEATVQEIGVFAFFVDSTADAIYSTALDVNTTNPSHLYMEHIYNPGTVSSVTYKVRGGPAAGAGNININGDGTLKLNGTAIARLTVEEL